MNKNKNEIECLRKCSFLESVVPLFSVERKTICFRQTESVGDCSSQWVSVVCECVTTF